MCFCNMDFTKWRVAEGRGSFDFIWLYVVVFLVCCVHVVFPYRHFHMPQCRFSCTCVSSLLRFLDFRFFIFICKSPGGSLKNNATLHFAKPSFFLAKWIVRRSYQFIWLYCVVFFMLCIRFLLPYRHFHMPIRRFSCTCASLLLRFLDLLFLVLICKSPRAARLNKTTKHCILQNRVFFLFAKWILQNGVRLKGPTFLWAYMPLSLSCFSSCVLGFCFRIEISPPRKTVPHVPALLRFYDFSTFASLYLFARIPGRVA